MDWSTRPTPGDAGTWDLVFNIGASGNDTGGSMVPLTGLIEDDVARFGGLSDDRA